MTTSAGTTVVVVVVATSAKTSTEAAMANVAQTLPETGVDAEQSVLVAGGLLVAGAGLVAAGRLRRRTR